MASTRFIFLCLLYGLSETFGLPASAPGTVHHGNPKPDSLPSAFASSNSHHSIEAQACSNGQTHNCIDPQQNLKTRSDATEIVKFLRDTQSMLHGSSLTSSDAHSDPVTIASATFLLNLPGSSDTARSQQQLPRNSLMKRQTPLDSDMADIILQSEPAPPKPSSSPRATNGASSGDSNGQITPQQSFKAIPQTQGFPQSNQMQPAFPPQNDVPSSQPPSFTDQQATSLQQFQRQRPRSFLQKRDLSSALNDDCLKRHNEIRQRLGLRSFVISPALVQAAKLRLASIKDANDPGDDPNAKLGVNIMWGTAGEEVSGGIPEGSCSAAIEDWVIRSKPFYHGEPIGSDPVAFNSYGSYTAIIGPEVKQIGCAQLQGKRQFWHICYYDTNANVNGVRLSVY